MPLNPNVFSAEFTIPCEWWQGTDTVQTERTRARRRRWVKEYAYDVWRGLKRRRLAHKVERFVAVVGVAYPRMDDVTPSRAAETVKPIIDAGTKAGLWPDDDAYHRCATVYFQLPEPARECYYRLQVFIYPVPDSNPLYQITGGVCGAVERKWRTIPESERPDGWEGYSVRFLIPNPIWITSNLTDSDLIARQHGASKSRHWGSGHTFGTRQKVSKRLREHVASLWGRQQYFGCERFIVLAGISYAHNVDKTQADPDNAAETVNDILRTGVDAGAWRGTSSRHCKAVGFFRDPYDSSGGTHGVRLLVIPIPDGYHILTAIGDSYAAAWDEYGERRK